MREERRRLVYDVVSRHGRDESIRGIARALRISRCAVRTILEEEEQRRREGESAVERELPAARTPKASKLDRYAERIEAWLDEHPDLTVTRLLEKLTEQGFDGRYTIVRMYLKEARRRRGVKTKTAVLIVETLPGQQCQFDWSPYDNVIKGMTVQLWSCTLSWSRARSFFGSDNTKQVTILTFLRMSFEVWQGVPHQAVTDSMPGVVDRWECNRPILNVRFVDFAAYYNFAVDIAPRADGAYKGKVERPFRYAEENLFNGRTFASFEHFLEVLRWWQRERAMMRPHPRTNRPLWEMLIEERPHLQPLPAKPYDTRDVVIRQVEDTGYVRHDTNLYRVPDDEQIGELVYLCIGLERLEIFDRGVHRLAEHERAPAGAKRIIGEQDARRRRYDVTLLTSRLAVWGQAAEDFAHRLRRHKRCAGPELSYILGLQLTWSADDIVSAMQHAMDYDAYDARAIERILAARFAPRTLAEQVADATRSRIRETMKDHPVQSRSLGSYSALRHGDAAPPDQQQETHDESPTPTSDPDQHA